MTDDGRVQKAKKRVSFTLPLKKQFMKTATEAESTQEYTPDPVLNATTPPRNDFAKLNSQFPNMHTAVNADPVFGETAYGGTNTTPSGPSKMTGPQWQTFRNDFQDMDLDSDQEKTEPTAIYSKKNTNKNRTQTTLKKNTSKTTKGTKKNRDYDITS
ncbi:hypothetical protein BX666DRAFT_2033122 [Dichotomocladium elegans]|nr:hypothetical protein BX666DRAFT_2033122 [Dichotomocladium elegans]